MGSKGVREASGSTRMTWTTSPLQARGAADQKRSTEGAPDVNPCGGRWAPRPRRTGGWGPRSLPRSPALVPKPARTAAGEPSRPASARTRHRRLHPATPPLRFFGGRTADAMDSVLAADFMTWFSYRACGQFHRPRSQATIVDTIGSNPWRTRRGKPRMFKTCELVDLTQVLSAIWANVGA